MTPYDPHIRRIVQEELQKNQLRSGFRMQQIPFHTHNGTDSPPIFQSQMTYVGVVYGATGVPYRNLPFPQGWSIQKFQSDGIYRINHNLQTLNYSVQLTQLLDTTVTPIPAWGTVLGQSTTYFDVAWVYPNTNPTLPPIAVDTSFSFSLTNISNKNPRWPLYNIGPRTQA
jgi:hypothetical protein